MKTSAIIFDLDGVIVSTDELHFRAWKRLAERLSIPFTRDDNERLRGVSRMESLEIILEKSSILYSEEEKHRLAEEKNNTYRESLATLSALDILPGVHDVLRSLKQSGIATAIGSSSKNASAILKGIGLANVFDTVVDGTHIARSKPDPEVFLLAANNLNADPASCIVVEDAEAGVEAGARAGMRVLAVGPGRAHPQATYRAENLASIDLQSVISR